MAMRVNSLFFLLLAFVGSNQVVTAEPLPELVEPAVAHTWVYRCADDVSIVAQVRRDDAAVWLPQAGYQVLPQVMAASGNKYQKGDLVLWGKDGEAFIREGDTTYIDCTADRRAAIWEDAKLRGVQFRAAGNEPGWYLELNPGSQQLLLVTGYGQQRLMAPLPEPETDSESRTSRYHTSNEEGDIVVTVQGQPCSDTMTGEQFQTRVSVEQGESSYQGCGRALY